MSSAVGPLRFAGEGDGDLTRWVDEGGMGVFGFDWAPGWVWFLKVN